MDVLRQYNKAAEALLLEALAKVREGKTEGASVILTECPWHAEEAEVPVWAKYNANVRLNKPMVSYLVQLARMVNRMRLNQIILPREKSRADYACFNAAVGSMSFDFANWLVEMEMGRIAENAPAPLKVGFWFGRDGRFGLHDDYRKRMFAHVVRPMLAFVGAVESEEAAQIGRVNESYCARQVCARVRRGESLVRMSASEEAMTEMSWHQGCVTITLREAEEWPHRNSNIPAWLKFAHDLERQGERVVFVRDTAKALEPSLDDFEDCPVASCDLDKRMALYQLAKMNFFVANGPALLATYSLANYRTFVNLQPDGHAYVADTPTFWRTKHGVEPGDQFPWALPNQRIVWSADTYEAISQAWEDRPYEAAA